MNKCFDKAINEEPQSLENGIFSLKSENKEKFKIQKIIQLTCTIKNLYTVIKTKTVHWKTKYTDYKKVFWTLIRSF